MLSFELQLFQDGHVFTFSMVTSTHMHKIVFFTVCEDRKLVLPSFAALPLLMAYAGHTAIIIPKPLIPYVGVAVLDLGKYLIFI